MINLSALSKISLASQSLSNLILVTPNKDQGITPEVAASADSSPESFLFDFYGEQNVTQKADITDHYVEDNTALQDHIAIRPKLYTCHGFVAELNNVVPKELEILRTAEAKLSTLQAYAPGVSATAIRVMNQATQAYQTAKLAKAAAVNAWHGNFLNKGAISRQEDAYNRLSGYFEGRVLFTVQTPWALFKNMAIETLRVVQGPDSDQISDFELTFKPIRIAKTISSGFVDFGQGRYNDQIAGQTNNGTSTPADSISAADSLTNHYSGANLEAL